jgi:hypothetical protein
MSLSPTFDNNAKKCAASCMALPDAEGDLNVIDGRSFLGCKSLHGTFVPLNPFHCAHICFKIYHGTFVLLNPFNCAHISFRNKAIPWETSSAKKFEGTALEDLPKCPTVLLTRLV